MNDELFTNNHGLRLIQEFEGKPRLKARECEGGAWELGYGITFDLNGNPFKEGDTCTEAEADALFRNALTKFEAGVRAAVTVPLNGNQFSALVAFSYNIGLDNFATSSVLRRVNENRMDDAAACFGMWVFATKNGHKQALRGLLRRRYAEACLFLSYQWDKACDDDAIALQRQIPDALTGTDRVIYKTPFKDVLAVAQNYPLEQPELVLTAKVSPATPPPLATAPVEKGSAVGGQPIPPPAASSIQVSPEPRVVPSAEAKTQAPVIPAPSAKPAPAPYPPAPAGGVIVTAPPKPPVVIAPKQIDPRTAPYGEILPDSKPKNMTDSARVIGLVIVGIGSIVQVLSAREIISTTIGAVFYDLSRDSAFVAMAAGGAAMFIGWLTRKRGTHIVTKGMVNARALLK